jgi:ABC-2 type transport system permease protein
VSGLAGTRTLLRLALRLDRVRALVWILFLGGLTVASASSNFDLYGTDAEREQLATSVTTNPALLALGGRAFDLTSVGGVTAYQMIAFTTTLIGLMSILLTVRHTRAEEESGRAELAGSGVVGRQAWLASSLLLVTGINVVLAVFIGLGLIGVGLPAAGSWAFAAGCAGCGVVFAVVAALAAQLTEHARTATGIAGAVLGLSYVLRAAGDAATATADNGLAALTWLSPIGWAELVRPYAGERWAVLLLFAAAAAALGLAVAALSARRDLGAGVLPPRLGPAVAAPSLRSSLALAWRLQRGSLLGWTLGFLVVGAAFGAVAESMVTVAEDNPDVASLIEDLGGSGTLVDVFIAAITSLVGVVVGAYAVQATLRLRTEETAHRAEPVLATAVPRARWAFSHILVALLGSVVVLAASGIAAGVAHGLRTGDLGTELPRVLGAALAHAPAVWVLIGVCVLLFGLVPRLSVLAWGVLALALVIGQFGEVLQLDQWALNLSPFTHVPDLPAADFVALPLVVLLLAAAVSVALGVAGFRRRDLA